LLGLSENCTTLMIAHRLSTIQHANIIIVLGKEGTIMEKGNHHELIEKNGIYSEMWHRQEEINL
jgi:ABC-type transport system involved in Fe-S cluster assembly fused permease/ATPase subunit